MRRAAPASRAPRAGRVRHACGRHSRMRGALGLLLVRLAAVQARFGDREGVPRDIAAQPRLVVWKSHEMPKDAEQALKSWHLHKTVVNDEECASLAKQHHCNGYFRSDIMNIMRSDACRYMALYKYAGVYADLDVHLLRELPQCNGLCGAYEYTDKTTIANFYISATRPHNACVMRAIKYCCANLLSVKMDFAASPHLVHLSCGPDAFTTAVRNCITSVMSRKALNTYVHHELASNRWKHGYPSWIVERMHRAGWRSVYEH